MPPRKRRKLTPPPELSDSDEPVQLADNANDTDSSSSHSASSASDDEDGGPNEAPPAAQPQSTKSRRKPGRPRKSDTARTTKKRTKEDTTPPRDLPPHERYFFDNRPGGTQTSSATLAKTALLSHDDYYAAMRDHIDPHQLDIDFLHDIHALNFEQWWFELRMGFSVCLHGWGAKRELLRRFAEFALTDLPEAQQPGAIVIVNAHAPGLTLRDILHTLASTIPSLTSDALPSQPDAALTMLLSALDPAPPHPTNLLLLHSIDAPALRRPQTQTHLSRLAAHPAIALLASANTPSFPSLWDARARAAFAWAFHDGTTCAAPAPGALELRPVDAVNALLGRGARGVGGRAGALFVLRSLTASARRLFALLLAEVLEGAGQEGIEAEDGADGDVGRIEYRALYRKAVAALVAASEVQFRALLKEFFDHEMVTNARDAAGTEFLGVPFRRDECERILEELALEE